MKTEKEIVEAYLEAINRQDVDAVMSFYAEDATFEIPGGFTKVGKQALRQLTEYDAALNCKLKFFDYVFEPGQVSHKTIEQNDYFRSLGVDELHHPSCSISINDGLITAIRAGLNQESREQMRQAEEAFDAWATKEKPEIVAKLVPDGEFIHSKESALELMALLREWKAEQA